MKIKAAVFAGGTIDSTIETLDLEPPRASEILVRIVAAGVCHTDLHCAQGYGVPHPVVLGHEGAGIVEEIGSAVTKVRPGDRVVLTVNSCGACPTCHGGHATYCDRIGSLNFGGARLDGTSPLSRDGQVVAGNFFGQSSFATYAIANERNTIKLPEDVPLELMGPLACGVQTGAGAVLNALQLRAGQSIAVFGTGGVGLSAVMAARVAGAARIIAVDRVASRLAMATELGATEVIDASAGGVREQILALTGRGVDYAFDTTGITAVLTEAILSLAPLGTCGLVAGSGEIQVPASHIMTGGRKVRGIVEGEAKPDLFIPTMIELWRQGRFPFDKMVKFYDFADINAAFHDAESGATIKPILRMPAA